MRLWQDADYGVGLHCYLTDTTGTEHAIKALGVFETSAWVHVAVTYDKVTGTARLYRNGTIITEENLGIFTPQTSYPLQLGSSIRTGRHFKGMLDEISVYTRPLSPSEVRAIYLAGATGKNPLDGNNPPVVNAGRDLSIPHSSASAALVGSVTDDGASGGVLHALWSKMDGPGSVTFATATSAVTSATFSESGIYVLRLTGDDGFNLSSDVTEVRVGVPNGAPLATSTAAWWSGNGDTRERLRGDHDVEFVNGLEHGPGQVSQAFVFDTGNAHGRIRAHGELDVGASTAGMTVELWVKPKGPQYVTLLQWGTSAADGVRLWQDSEYGVGFHCYLTDTAGVDHAIKALGIFETTAWAHVAVTYDKVSGVARIYCNGALRKEENLGVFTPQTSFPVQLGASLREKRYFQGSLDEISLYTRPLSSSEIHAIYLAGAAGKAPAVGNVAPFVNAGPDGTLPFGVPFPLLATASDDGLPNPPGGLSYHWVLVNGPGSVAFSAPTSLATSATFSTAGNYTLRFSANDSEFTGFDEIAVTVTPTAPTIALTAPLHNAVLIAGTATMLTVAATDLDGTVSKVEYFDGSTKLGEAGSPPFSLLIPAGFAPGTHALTAKATDNFGLSTISAPITISSHASASLPPAIAIFEPTSGASLGVGASFEIAATVIDTDGTITKVEFFQGSTKLGEQTLPELGHPTTYFWPINGGLSEGSYTFTAKATDNTGVSTMSAPVTITVSSEPDSSNAVFIATPGDSMRVAAPMSVTGVIALPGLTSWKLQYRLRPPGDDTSSALEPWLTAASGTTVVGTTGTAGTAPVPGVIGSFDPTLLLNGLYELRLLASTSASTTTTSPTTLVVEGNMKVGAFTLAFEDVKIPVAGIPVSVTRTYDSRDARVGDFGPGWRIAVANVRVQKSRHLGTAWYQTPQSGSGVQFYYIDPVHDRVVAVTMPDGETHRFRAGVDVKVRPGDPDNASFAVVVRRGKYQFYPLGNTTAKLEPLNVENELASDFWIGGTGDQDLRADDPVSDPFAPTFNTSRFRLTTKDGSTYLIDEHLGLLELRDLHGNSLLLNRDLQGRVNGLVSKQSANAGGHSSTLTIVRDAVGRVDYIRDAADRDIDYIYDASGNLESVANRALEVTQFRYENLSFPHYLTKIIDPRGVLALRSDYDSAGKLIKQIDADGKETVFTRGIDGTGRFEKVKGRVGQETTFYYDDRGNVTLKIDPLGGQTSFTYDANDNPLTVTDPLGHTRSTSYDSQHNPLSETDPLGHSTTFTYNAFSLPLTITDARGKVTTNAYDPKGNLLTTTNAKGETTSFTYDAGGRLTQAKNALNHTTTHTYTPEGWPASTTDELGHATTWTYDVSGNQLTQAVRRTTADGSVAVETTTHVYDQENRRTKTTLPDGTFSRIAYNVVGKMESTTGPLGRVTSYVYDARGSLTTTRYADGTSDSSTYDGEGRVVTTTDRTGRGTSTSYDALGRPTQVTLADGASSHTTYDAAGRMTSVTDPRGNKTTFGYDAAGRRTSTKNALDETSTSTFDENGAALTATDALGRTTNFSYDDTGIRTRVTFADSTSQDTVHDPLGRKISATDQTGKIVRWRYDARGHLIEVRQYSDQSLVPTDSDYHLPDGTFGLSITRYAYDEVGNQVSQTDALGRVTRFAYDALGRRVSRTLPGNQNETYSYDAAGNLSSKKDFNGYTTSYGYDLLDRLVEKRADATHPSLSLAHAAAKHSYSYNALGQRTEATVFSGSDFGEVAIYSEGQAYDFRDRPSARTTPTGTLNYGYDNQSNLISIKSNEAAAGLDVIYTYDPLNRLATVGTRDPVDGLRKTATYGYDRVGNLSSVVLPNGVATRYSYDPLNRLKTLSTDRLGAIFSIYSYTLDAAGRRVGVSEINDRRHGYTYDGLNRLTSETIATGAADAAPSGLISYTHDAVGNRLSRTSSVFPVRSTISSYDANDRFTGDTYDANGNTLQGATAGLPISTATDIYDFENRLISRNGGAIKLLYDCDGHRVSETVGAQTISYLVDTFSLTGYAQVAEERVNGVLTRSYTHGHNLVSQTQATLSPSWSTSYHGYDGHGSVVFLADATGAVTDTYGYDAFGILISRTSAAPQPTFNRYRYIGQQYDDDLGLYYLRARYMNPENGRFWTKDDYPGSEKDPISLHKYLYASADPVGLIDPSGRFSSIAEVQAGATVSVTMSLVLVGHAGTRLIDGWELGVRNQLSQFALENRSQPLSAAGFQALRDRFDNHRRKLFLHYSDSQHTASILAGLRAPSWATDEVYFTGWSAKLRLALPHVDPPNTVFLVFPRSGFEPRGPSVVEPAMDRANRFLPGGGREFYFEKGSGGLGTVFGPFPVSEGSAPHF